MRSQRRAAGRVMGRLVVTGVAVCGLVSGSVLALTALPAAAAGTTITVITTEDGPVAACTTSTSCPTLRDAAAQANTLATSSTSPVTIVLPASTTDVSDGEITLGSSTNQDFTLTGPTSNAGGATIQATGSPANQGAGILQTAVVAGVNATFENLTMTGGSATTGSTYGGGAILAGDTNTSTTVTNCVFSDNTSGASAGGGAIAIEGGANNLTITDSTFTGNSTTAGPGGAVLVQNNGGTVTLTGDTFTNNTASVNAADGAGFGGAIQVVTATLDVTSSVFENNWPRSAVPVRSSRPRAAPSTWARQVPRQRSPPARSWITPFPPRARAVPSSTTTTR